MSTGMDRHSLRAHVSAYYEWMHLQNFSKATIASRRYILEPFLGWCAERGLELSTEITKPILERYRVHLFNHRKVDGKPLAFSSQHTMLSSIRAFFRWLTRESHILYNPASELELPKKGHRLPRNVLNTRQMESVLGQPNLKSPFGLRDRAILETLYSTAMRAGELCRLDLCHVDADRGTVFIVEGKGKKDRTIPIGERALGWIAKYHDDVRPELLQSLYEPTLFLNRYGERLTPSGLAKIAVRHLRAAGFGGACHVFRHSCATLMLEGGADVRYVQQLLGHTDLSTTETYTHVSIVKLKEIHTATHPARSGLGAVDRLKRLGYE